MEEYHCVFIQNNLEPAKPVLFGQCLCPKKYEVERALLSTYNAITIDHSVPLGTIVNETQLALLGPVAWSCFSIAAVRQDSRRACFYR